MVSPRFDWSAAGGRSWGLGGGVRCLGATGSGTKDLRCKAISAFRRASPSFFPFNRYPVLKTNNYHPGIIKGTMKERTCSRRQYS